MNKSAPCLPSHPAPLPKTGRGERDQTGARRERIYCRVSTVLLAVTLLASSQGLASEPLVDRSPRASLERSKRVLIVTGEDYKGHHWQQTAPLLKLLIRQDSRLNVEVVEDLNFLRDRRLSEYDVIVAHFKNYDSQVPGRVGYDNLAKFVEQGGGLVLIHFACGAFEEFKGDFVQLAGRVWNPELRGHDPHREFTVEMSRKDHPITVGLDAFKTTDELYTCLDGGTPITVLAQATSVVDKKVYPMAFVLRHGKGRVFHTTLGHDAAAIAASGTALLIRRGTAWTAGLDPSNEAGSSPKSIASEASKSPPQEINTNIVSEKK